MAKNCKECEHRDLKESWCDPVGVCLLNEVAMWEREEELRERERSSYLVGSYCAEERWKGDFQR